MNRLLRTLAWIAAGAAAGAAHYHLTKKLRPAPVQEQGLKHRGTVTLETKRLILRKFTLEDAEPMFRNWASDPEVNKYLTWPTHPDVKASEEIVQMWVDGYEGEKCSYNWAIELREIGEPIGSISVVHSDERIPKAELGYCIGKSWWRQGIMTEALTAVLNYLFDEGYERIGAMHDVNNPHSGDVMKKCGMQYEGTLRGYGHSNQGACDLCVYSILREDYQKGETHHGT